jgi:amino acid permease
VLILPLCFTQKIDFLKYAAAMGVFVILYVVFLIIYEYFRHGNPQKLIIFGCCSMPYFGFECTL